MTLVEVVVALAITGVTVAGVVSGYIYCTTATAKDALYMAANSRASERMEEIRAAVWNTSVYPNVDQLTTNNFPDTTNTLNKDGTGSDVTPATIKTTISQISDTPPLRRVRVDCIWVFKGTETITNTIETCRAPNQ
jgi:type II secretory pathway pseudopilin PulG